MHACAHPLWGINWPMCVKVRGWYHPPHSYVGAGDMNTGPSCLHSRLFIHWAIPPHPPASDLFCIPQSTVSQGKALIHHKRSLKQSQGPERLALCPKPYKSFMSELRGKLRIANSQLFWWFLCQGTSSNARPEYIQDVGFSPGNNVLCDFEGLILLTSFSKEVAMDLP